MSNFGDNASNILGSSDLTIFGNWCKGFWYKGLTCVFIFQFPVRSCYYRFLMDNKYAHDDGHRTPHRQ